MKNESDKGRIEKHFGFGVSNLLIPILLSVLLIFIYQFNFLFFHTLAEMFAILIAILLAVISWYMYPFTRNNFLMYLGCGYVWVGVLDMFHTLAYKGMPIFEVAGGNLGVQFWIGTRYLEALLLLSAPWFLRHELNRSVAFMTYMLLSLMLIASIFSEVFPQGYIEGQGLTAFKIYSEYTIIAILAIAIVYLRSQRLLLDRQIMNTLVLSITCTMIAELAFTFYVSVYGFSNMVGHIFKIFSYWFIFQSMIRTTLQEPFQAMSRSASTYDAIPDATIVVDHGGVIRQANRSAGQLAGMAVENLIGNNCHTIYHPNNISEEECPVCQREILRPGVADVDLEITQLNKWLSFSSSPTLKLPGIEGSVEVIRDITKKVESRVEYNKLTMLKDAIVDNLPMMLFVKNARDNSYVEWNKAAEEMTGVSKEEMLGRTDYDLWPKPQADFFIKKDNEVLESGELLDIPQEPLTTNGQDLTLHTKKIPIYTNKGDDDFLLGISEDITEKLQVEDALKKSQQRLQLHRELSPLGIIEWNTDFEFLDVNPAVEKTFGFTKEELVGKHITDTILPETAREQVEAIWKKLISNTGGEHSININITKSGELITCEWTNTPLIDDGGNVVGVASFVEDVTNQLQHEQQLRRAQKMDALGKLTGGIAHDYNNTLGVIVGFAELLLTRSFDENQVKEFAEHIQHAGERGTKLTKKLLSMSKMKPFEAERVNINVLLKDDALMVERTLTARIKCEFNLADELWDVFLDQGDLEDSILNISINAMHAIKDSGTFKLTTKNVSLSRERAIPLELEPGDYVSLELADSGCGMENELLSKIFDPFFSSKGELGTGLGLSQVYGFVQRSGGAISVASEVGKGSQFTLYFPRLVKEIDSELGAGSTKERLAGDESILIVDDEDALRELFVASLKNYGYQVVCAESADEALSLLANQHIDMLISDVIMPNMNGFELAEQVSMDYPDIKIQLISGYTGKLEAHINNAELAKNILTKPFSQEELATRIRFLFDS